MNLEHYSHPTQVKHHFGYMNGLNQQVGLSEYGQFVVVDQLQQAGRRFELGAEDYTQLLQSYRAINLRQDQGLYIDIEADEQDVVVGWQLMILPYSLDYAAFLIQHAYNRSHLYDVFAFINQIENLSLQSFMWSLFSQPEFATRFVANPASKQHHHAYPGGLLEHSLECMQIVRAAMDQVTHFSKREKDLTQVAALLHDVGKTRTLNAEGNLTLEGFNVNHEHYTLSVITADLRQLKKTYEHAAVALEYLLTWKFSDGYPKFIGATLIKAADRVSTGSQVREQAFADLPPYFHFAHVKTGSSSLQLSRLN